MKCVSYDYDFEKDLAAKWKAHDRRRRRLSITDSDSEVEDEAPTSKSRDHLSRKVRCKKNASQEDSSSVVVYGPEGFLDEGEEELYHDGDVGDFSEY
jgi:hypothetical protein